MKWVFYFLAFFVLIGCSLRVKENVIEKPVSTMVEREEQLDEYEMLFMDAKKLTPVQNKALQKFLNNPLPDVFAENEKRESMKIQINRKAELLSRAENTETLQTKDYLKLLPRLKIEQQPVTVDGIQKTQNFYAFEIDLSRGFDLFDASGNRKVEKMKARLKIKTLYFEIKRLIEKKAYYKDSITRYEQQLNSRDVLEQKEAREKIPQFKMLVTDTDIQIAQKELEQEYAVLELQK